MLCTGGGGIRCRFRAYERSDGQAAGVTRIVASAPPLEAAASGDCRRDGFWRRR